MALKELYQAMVGENDFWKQVAGAIMVAAKDIIAENPGTANHEDRLAWALKAQNNPKSAAKEMLVDVLKNATIAADVEGATDNDVQFVVNSLIDTYAG